MEETIQEIFKLAEKKMLEQGGYDRHAFKQFVEESIMYFREKGKLTDDDSDEFIISQLMSLWDNRVVEDDIEKHNI